MANRVFVVSADRLEKTDRISHAFMFEEGVPANRFADLLGFYGVVTLGEKPENYVNVVAFLRGEANAVGPDGKNRWNITIIESGVGLYLGLGVDEGGEAEVAAAFEELPNCVILTHKEALPLLKKALIDAGVLEVEENIFEFPGTLSTSK